MKKLFQPEDNQSTKAIVVRIKEPRAVRAPADHAGGNSALGIEKHLSNGRRAATVLLRCNQQGGTVRQALDQRRFRLDAAVIQPGRKRKRALANLTFSTTDDGDIGADARAHNRQAIVVELALRVEPMDPVGDIGDGGIPIARAARFAVPAQINVLGWHSRHRAGRE